ncbi:hypothetical protein B9Z55_001701 [Caenorhabditis nigoni]|uniref:DUF4708 domain-containing protein n=1 Tax=Caenorhabditis nigoni TaxID=1611254 RepID=A0A2G5VGZ1_9PELO|nr:hypothetical protein B9Z55_001701 [Caenorhabditis nigoni]
MNSQVIPVVTLNMKKLKSVYLSVDMEYDNRKNAALAILSKLSRDLLETCKAFGGCLAIPQRDLCTILLTIDPENLKNEVLVGFLEKQMIKIKLESDCDTLSIESSLPFAVFYFMEKVGWFRIGECFVQGDFLSWNHTNLPRIQIMTHCSERGNVYIKLTAEFVRIHPFEHYILDSDERFTDLHSGPITRKIRRPRWISCLPKLGKGQIVKIHRKIPEDAPFENYTQMMSYWKKTYGYNLPNSEPEVYYDIQFHNGQSMLYPWYCILTGTPEVLPIRANSNVTKDALAMFLKSFKEAGIEICGYKMGSESQDCLAVKSYMDVMSMKPNSNLPKIQKVSRSQPSASSDLPPVRKIYPKIPMKRTASSDASTSSPNPTKRKRPGFTFSVD